MSKHLLECFPSSKSNSVGQNSKLPYQEKGFFYEQEGKKEVKWSFFERQMGLFFPVRTTALIF